MYCTVQYMSFVGFIYKYSWSHTCIPSLHFPSAFGRICLIATCLLPPLHLPCNYTANQSVVLDCALYTNNLSCAGAFTNSIPKSATPNLARTTSCKKRRGRKPVEVIPSIRRAREKRDCDLWKIIKAALSLLLLGLGALLHHKFNNTSFPLPGSSPPEYINITHHIKYNQSYQICDSHYFSAS